MVGYDECSDHEGSVVESVASLSTMIEWSATINGPPIKALSLSRRFFKHDDRVVGYDKWSDHEGSILESVTWLSTMVEWSAMINIPTMKALSLSQPLL